MRLLGALLVVSALLLAGCAAVTRYEISQQELQTRVDKRFPMQRQVGFAALTISAPKVMLKPQNNGIGVAVVLKAELPGQLQASGTALVDGVLDYQASSGEFFLRQPTVAELNIDGLPPAFGGMLRGVVSDALATNFPSIVLYQLDEKDLKQALAKRMFKGVHVEPGRIVVDMNR